MEVQDSGPGLYWMLVVKLILIDIVFKLYFVPIDVFVTHQFCLMGTPGMVGSIKMAFHQE